MTIDEARAAIAAEYLEQYAEWLQGQPDRKDGIRSVVAFQQTAPGRYLPEWEKAGFPRRIIWELVRQGFLTEEVCRTLKAVREGKTHREYISEDAARAIWKAARGK